MTVEIPKAAFEDMDLRFYWVDAHNPNSTALEILDALGVRDILEPRRASMTAEQLKVLVQADLALLENGEVFHETLKSLLDIEEERKHEKIGPERWWWFLDRLPLVFVILQVEHGQSGHGARMIVEEQADDETKALAAHLTEAYPHVLSLLDK